MSNCKQLAALEQAEHNRYKDFINMKQVKDPTLILAALSKLNDVRDDIQKHLKECKICKLKE